jgi:dUTP pyrophosphatase
MCKFARNFKRMKIKIVNKSAFDLPQYATSQSAGLDLRANINNPVILKPLERKLVPTGLFIELPDGYEAQVRPRSGLAIKHGISLVNTPGTIDPDYRGEIRVILINLSNDDFILNPGERIAQMIICKFERIEWENVVDLSVSERGDGGFGSTGTK